MSTFRTTTYLVKCKEDMGESIGTRTFWAEFASPADVERFLLYHARNVFPGDVYKATRINVKAITEDVKRVVGYKVEE